MGNQECTPEIDDVEVDIPSDLSKGAQKVRSKILNSPYYQKKYENQIKDISNILSTKKKLLDTYLSTNWLGTQQFQNSLEKYFEGEEFKKSSLVGSGESPEDVQSTPSLQEIREVQGLPDFRLDHEVKIKFILAEILKFRKRPVTKAFYFNVITPFMTHIVQNFPDFGCYHLALQVGPWIIEWNSSGLCIPRKLVSTAALLSHDIGCIATKKDVQKTVGQLADCIIRWNTEFVYCKNRGDGKTCGNCQEFTMDCLKAMNIELNLSGPMARYIEKLMANGSNKLEFATDKFFDKKFNLKPPKGPSGGREPFVFESHIELDTFVTELFKVDPSFQHNYKSEYDLLKAFDRAIWLRHLKLPKDKTYFPLMKTEKDEDGDEYEECACPFQDPRESKSFVYLKEEKKSEKEFDDEENSSVPKKKDKKKKE